MVATNQCSRNRVVVPGIVEIEWLHSPSRGGVRSAASVAGRPDRIDDDPDF